MTKKMIAIAVATSVALIGIWYFAVFSRQSKSIHNANAATAAADQQANSLRSDIALLQREKAALPVATEKLTTLKLALPDTPVLDKLIDDINAAAVLSGVDWQTITPTKPATYGPGTSQAAAAGSPGGAQAITVGMSINGNYRQVTDFVSKLTGLSRLLDVTSVNLSGVGGTVKSTAQLTTQIFFVPAATAAPATTTTTLTH